MQVSHSPALVSALFDDPNLVSCAGLAPVVALAERCGLTDLVASTLTLPVLGGVNAHLKVPALVAGMVAGADSIDDMGLLRHGGMDRLFAGVRAPSTLGTFLRTFTFGHVRQLDSVAATMLAELARRTPLLAGADQVAYVDVDDTVKATYGYAKQGAGFGYSGVKGPERADRDREHTAVRAGDLRDPAPQGQHQLRSWRVPAGRRRAPRGQGRRRGRPGRHWADRSAR